MSIVSIEINFVTKLIEFIYIKRMLFSYTSIEFSEEKS